MLASQLWSAESAATCGTRRGRLRAADASLPSPDGAGRSKASIQQHAANSSYCHHAESEGERRRLLRALPASPVYRQERKKEKIWRPFRPQLCPILFRGCRVMSAEGPSVAGLTTLPTIFISHGGGPWPWMDFGPTKPFDKLAAYLRALPSTLPGPVKVVLCVSGHWEEREVTVMTAPHPPMLYDYYGFPDHTYSIKYDAPGAPSVAARVRQLLSASGIGCQEDAKRGFDHGTFVPIAVCYPNADIPVLQLSLKAGYDPAFHVAVGRALEPLRREGVLIIGSGLSYHNLRFPADAERSSKTFDDWLTTAVADPDPESRNRKLLQWSSAPAARNCHPQEDHLIPLMVAAGAAGSDVGRKTFKDFVVIHQGMPGFHVSNYQFG